jgi:hypothetical protein
MLPWKSQPINAAVPPLANSLSSYLMNSSMLLDLQKDADGG